MKVSAVVLTKNAQRDIVPCLQSLSWCDEILVIDDNSIDDTATIVVKHGARVLSHPLENDFARQRNFALQKAKNEWVLFVDSDERVTPELRESITKDLVHPTEDGYYIKRRDFLWGKPLLHGEAGKNTLLRLGKKKAGKWVGNVHEVWDIKKTKELQGFFFHYPHPILIEFLSEINFYTTIRAQELFEKGVRVHWWDMLIYPKAKFLQNYIFRLGFLDGIRGLVVAILMSFHSFLVRGKIWQLQENN